MLDLTKPISTRDGRPVTLITTRGREPYPILGYVENSVYNSSWAADGSFDGAYTPSCDLINIPESKRSGEIWMNQFDVMGRTVHDTREEADKFVEFIGDRRIACVRVPWTEGEGLEGK